MKLLRIKSSTANDFLSSSLFSESISRKWRYIGDAKEDLKVQADEWMNDRECFYINSEMEIYAIFKGADLYKYVGFDLISLLLGLKRNI